MVQEQLDKYVWLLDTISRYKRLSRQEIDDLWRKSKFSRGEGLPRRTFYNYRQAIEEIFGTEILYDTATREYYIAENPRLHGASMTDWLLNSATTNMVLGNAQDIANRILLEDVPSARQHLSTVMEAIKDNHVLEFDYAPYTRVNPSPDVILKPLFLNLLRQRWYVTGLTADDKIKTYALDRMLDAKVLPEVFTPPADFDVDEYTRFAFGVIFSQGPVYDITLRADSRRAKYLRTLPLHLSQHEEVHDSYSLFHYRLRLTPDLISEILSLGSSVTVVKPAELRAMILAELHATLKNY